MPNAPRTRGGQRSDHRGAGGTAVEPSGAMAWVAGAVALLLIGGGTIYFMTRDGGAKKQSKAATSTGPVVAPKAFVRNRPVPDQPPAPVRLDAATRTPEVQGRAAAVTLRDALNAQQLWTEVDYAGGSVPTLVLRTAYCADAKLKAVVDKTTPTLRAAKVSKLRCEARHGSLVFELDL